MLLLLYRWVQWFSVQEQGAHFVSQFTYIKTGAMKLGTSLIGTVTCRISFANLLTADFYCLLR
jgi:hypothetical protein